MSQTQATNDQYTQLQRRSMSPYAIAARLENDQYTQRQRLETDVDNGKVLK